MDDSRHFSPKFLKKKADRERNMTVKLFEEIEIEKVRVSAQQKYILDLYNNFVKHWAWDGLKIKAVVVVKDFDLPQYVLEQTSASPLYEPNESIIPKVLGYLEIIPAYLHSTDQYDIRLVCTWPPVRSFWEGMAHHLQPENLYNLPKHLVPEGPWYRPPQSLVLPEKPPSPQEYLKPLPNTIESALLSKFENPKMKIGRLGTHRSISTEDAMTAVKECEEFVERNGTVVDYFNNYLAQHMREECGSIETFRSWIKKFGDPKKHKRKKRKAKN
jgi:hypothetical protein